MGCDWNRTSIALLGLPGVGKHRLKRILVDHVGCQSERVEIFPGDVPTERLDDFQQVWCVIDVRSVARSGRDDLSMQRLKTLVEASDGVVFNFTEASELDTQAFWSRWIKQEFDNVPIVRLLNQQLPNGWCGFETRAGKKRLQAGDPESEDAVVQTYEFEVGRVCLDHLMMGLDSSRENLGMQIWRVQAVVDTFEYENLVAIEATPFRWDTFAADPDAVPGWIRIEGIDLQQAWLDEIVRASLLSS